jgi:hypothetical protein
MNWRFFLFVSSLMAMFVVNFFLVFGEAIPEVVTEESTVRVPEVSLRSIQYKMDQIRANLQKMGMTLEHADKTSDIAEKIYSKEKTKNRLIDMIKASEENVAPAVCPSGQRVAQPYAMLELIVEEALGRRTVLSVNQLSEFNKQPWYASSSVERIYEMIEKGKNRQPDATLMGVSALLLNKEDDAIKGKAPWANGFMGRWGFSYLLSNPKTGSIERMSSDYFALMYVVVTLANDERNGICDS